MLDGACPPDAEFGGYSASIGWYLGTLGSSYSVPLFIRQSSSEASYMCSSATTADVSTFIGAFLHHARGYK